MRKKIYTYFVIWQIIIVTISLLMKDLESILMLSAISTLFFTLVFFISNKISGESEYQQTFKGIIKSSRKYFWQNINLTIMLGDTNSGKSAILEKNGYKKINIACNQIPMSTWWRKENDVVLEITKTNNSSMVINDKTNVFWRDIICGINNSVLFGASLNNITVTMSIAILHPNQEHLLAEHNTSISNIIELFRQDKSNIKHNIILTHCDKIIGFQSFFSDLSQEQKQQALKIIQDNDSKNTFGNVFQEKFAKLVLNTNRLALKRLKQEHDPFRKFEIKDFPMQIEQLQKPIASIIQSVENATNCMGVYFCCNKISDVTYDFIHSKQPPKKTNKQFFLIHPNEDNNSYFSQNIMKIIREGKISTIFSSKDIIMISSMSIACLIMSTMCYSLYNKYSITKDITTKIDEIIANRKNTNNNSVLDKLYLSWNLLNRNVLEEKTINLNKQFKKHYHSYLQDNLQQDINKAFNKKFIDMVENNQNFYNEIIALSNIDKPTAAHYSFLMKNIDSKHNYIKQHLQQFFANTNFNFVKSQELQQVLLKKLQNFSIADKAIMLLNKPIPSSFTLGFPNEAILQKECYDKIMTESINKSCNAMQIAGEISQVETPKCIATTQDEYAKQYINYWQYKASVTKIVYYSSLLEIEKKLQEILETRLIEKNISQTRISLTKVNMNQESYQNWLDMFGNKELQVELSELLQLIKNINEDKSYKNAYQEIVKQAINNNAVITKILKTADKLAPLQKEWLINFTQQTNRYLEMYCYEYLNDIWQSTVFKIYEKKLANKFPLDSKATIESSISDFEQFFAPDGIYMTYLQLLQPLYGKELYNKISQENIKSFGVLNQIIESWFSNQQKIQLQMTLVPMMLEHNANSFTLELGNRKILFNKESEKTNEIIWPEPGDHLVTIEFENKLGQNSIKNNNSTWSMLRLLSNVDISTIKNKKEFIITFKLDEFRAKYHLIFKQNFDIFSAGGINNFKLSKKL